MVRLSLFPSCIFCLIGENFREYRRQKGVDANGIADCSSRRQTECRKVYSV